MAHTNGNRRVASAAARNNSEHYRRQDSQVAARRQVIPIAENSIPRLVIEHRYTRDAQVPLFEGDDDLDHGWRAVPIPPSLDDGWEIFDTRKDYKTGWRRFRIAWEPMS
jgi:hypothetical protein